MTHVQGQPGQAPATVAATPARDAAHARRAGSGALNRTPPDFGGALIASPLRLLPARRLPLLVLLALAAALLSLPSAASTQASAAQTVPADWALIPAGIEPGDSFRLLFVTSATRDASSADVADYNAFVQAAANNNDSLKSFKDQFRALISTSAVDARDNTATTGTGVPVHWLGGEKVADDYADLYGKSWDSVSGRTEGGGAYTGLVWTGGNKAGQKSGQKYAGAAEVRLGDGATASVAAGTTFLVWAQQDRPSSEDTRVTIVVQATGGAGYEFLHDYAGIPDAMPEEGWPLYTYRIHPGETTPEDDATMVAIKATKAGTLQITATATNAQGITQSTQVLTVTVTGGG